MLILLDGWIVISTGSSPIQIGQIGRYGRGKTLFPSPHSVMLGGGTREYFVLGGRCVLLMGRTRNNIV
jgi:hypothetical protein